MKQLLLLLTLSFTFRAATGQDIGSSLNAKAVKIDSLDQLDNKVYDLLQNNKLIMIGEMHGTNEPATFVQGLADLFTRNGDSVQVGFEIPREQMTSFLNLGTDSSITHSDFFTKTSSDGRASVAWASTISVVSRNPKVIIFFYDLNTGESHTMGDRDSLMYVNIKKQMIEHPSWTTITLSGNIHNMRLPYKEQNKMGAYLANDTDLRISDKCCVLNHMYQRGTMLNNIGNGLELRHIDNIDSYFAQLLDCDNYLYLFPSSPENSYDGIFFTRTVTAAALANKK